MEMDFKQGDTIRALLKYDYFEVKGFYVISYAIINTNRTLILHTKKAKVDIRNFEKQIIGICRMVLVEKKIKW